MYSPYWGKQSQMPLLCPKGWCIKWWRVCLFSVSVWVSVAVRERKVPRGSELQRAWQSIECVSLCVCMVGVCILQFCRWHKQTTSSLGSTCFVWAWISQPLLSVCFHLMNLPIPGKLPAVSLCAQLLMFTHSTEKPQWDFFLSNHSKHCKFDKVVNKKWLLKATALISNNHSRHHSKGSVPMYSIRTRLRVYSHASRSVKL